MQAVNGVKATLSRSIDVQGTEFNQQQCKPMAKQPPAMG